MSPVLAALLVGCSEYDFTPEELGTLQLSPEAIELEGACAYEERTLTFESVGEYAVELISLSIDGTGWVMLEMPTLPLSLEPGESAELVLLGNAGDATLVVVSDDPDAPTRTVSLSGGSNTAPEIVWLSPDEGQAIAPGDELRVGVVDGDDDPEELVVRWSSDVDGVVAAAFGDASGEASAIWGEGTGGEHNLTATVTDTCGATASVEREVCRQEGYFGESLDLSTWAMEGDARYDEDQGWVELTDVASTFQLGSAFQTTPTRGDNVQLSFSFYVSGGSGADGFAVTALDTDRASTFTAQSGGCLGYGGGGICGDFEPLYGWNVELDTYFSGGLDPTEQDHLSFHFDGDVAGYEAFAALPEMEDGAWHTMTIRIVAPRVTISVDGVTWIDEDIEGYYDFPAQVGFTAATGGETNYHLIDDLAVIEEVCGE